MDSWEQDVPEDALSDLNINAKVFVPGRNIHAVEFVPGGIPAPSSQSSVALPTEISTDSHVEISATENDSANVSAREDSPEQEPMIEEEEEEEEEIEKKKRRSRQATENDLKKETISLVFIGHVDAGKSTIGGHILHLTGMVDQRTLEKYEREAKERNRETWYLSYALDTNVEERVKGKTVECGRGYFETDTKHFVLLDAPGHKSFVPNMISGAAQADLAILVISARRGEFETGFEKGGQTREHAMLVKTAGVKHLIVLINKMDDPTVEWQGERYNECKEKLLPYLKKVGFNPKTDIYFMPCSGLTGAGLKDQIDSSLAPWYTGPSLLSYLENLPALSRSNQGPLRLPIAERFKDMGTIVYGKVETGSLSKGQQLVVMPNKVNVEVLQIVSDDLEVDFAQCGDSVKVKLKNVEEDDISNGFVLCAPDNLCQTGFKFDAQFVVLEHKSIICPGYTAVMHLHCCVEEVTLNMIICTIDKKTNNKKQIKPRFIKQDDAAIGRFEVNGGAVCMETFKDFQQMGRFTLRDEGKTIAIGKILKIVQATSNIE